VDGDQVRAQGAELVLRHRDDGPELVIATGGPRSRRVAARFGDGWNVYAGVDGEHAEVADAIADMRRACEEVGRDPDSLSLTIDTPVDVLDRYDKAEASRASLARLAELGAVEARCYLAVPDTHLDRMAGLRALPEFRPS